MSARKASQEPSIASSEAAYTQDGFETLEDEELLDAMGKTEGTGDGDGAAQAESVGYSEDFDGESVSGSRQGQREAQAWTGKPGASESVGRRNKSASSSEQDFPRSRNRRPPSPRRSPHNTFAAAAYSSGNSHTWFPRSSDDSASERSLNSIDNSPYYRGQRDGRRRPQSAYGRNEGGRVRGSGGDYRAGTAYEAPGQKGTDARHKRLLQGLLQRDPRTWDTVEVRHWLDAMGLSQHQHKFGNYAVDGRTLLKLTDDSLYDDIGIRSDAQRIQILRCIRDLKECVSYSPTPPRRRRREVGFNSAGSSSSDPGDFMFGYASGEANAAQLREIIDKAQLRADKLRSESEAKNRLRELADKEVVRARKQLAALKGAATRGLNASGSFADLGDVPFGSTSSEANVARLRENLDKAQQRADRLSSESEDKNGQWEFAGKEVERLRAQLTAVKSGGSLADEEGDEVTEMPWWLPTGEHMNKTHWNPNPKMYGVDRQVPARHNMSKMNEKSKKILKEKEEKEKEEKEEAAWARFERKRVEGDVQFLRQYFFAKYDEMPLPTNPQEALRIVAGKTDDSRKSTTKTDKVFERLHKVRGDRLWSALANFIRVEEFVKRTVTRQGTAKMAAEKAREKVEDPAKVAERNRMYRALGMIHEGDKEVSSADLSALLKRARVFKVLDEETMGVGANLAGDETRPSFASAADFTFSKEDPRFIDLCEDGLSELEENYGEVGVLDHVVDLLKLCRQEELAKGMRMRCDSEDPRKANRQREAKAAYVYNLYRTQRYLQTCEEDIRRREEKHEKIANGELDTGLQTVKTAPKGQYGDFMKRLNKDLEKRKSRRDTTGLTGAELRQLKQESIMNSSVLYQRRNQQKPGGLAPSPAIQPALSAM